MREIYECTGCQARFRDGEVKPFYLRNPDGAGHFIQCPKCGLLKGVKDLRMPPPVPVPDEDPPTRRGISTAAATVLGMVAGLAPDQPPRENRIAGQERCTSCGRVEEHAPDCKPPRGYRKV